VCLLFVSLIILHPFLAALKYQEDRIVSRLVMQYGPKCWSAISKHLHGRTGKQCRER